MNGPKNKRTFKKFRIEEFPEMDVLSTTRKLVEMYGEHLGFKEVEVAEIGYIGYSNKKFKLKQMMTFRGHLKVANCTRIR